jgi:predicted ATPase
MQKPFLRGIQLLRERIERPDEYPFSLPAVQAIDSLSFHPDVTFLVGENGVGSIDPIAYKATEHYIITREFLTRTDRMLADLMSDDEEA